MPKITIIILHYKLISDTVRLLDSIFKFHEKLNGSIEIILVNNSPDQEKEIKKWLNKFLYRESVIYLRMPFNVGFSRGINYAIEKSTGKYILLQNNDSYFVDDSIWLLLNFLENNSSYKAVGGKIVNKSDGTITPVGAKVATPFTECFLAFKLHKILGFFFKKTDDFLYSTIDRSSDSFDAQSLCNAFILIEKEALVEIGGLLDSFLYFTEHAMGQEFLLRGYKTRYLHGAKCYHDWGKSTKLLQNVKVNAIYLYDRFIYLKTYFSLYSAAISSFCCFMTSPLAIMHPFKTIHFLNETVKVKKLLRSNEV